VGLSPTFLLRYKMPAIARAGIEERVTALSEQAARGTNIEIAGVELRGSGKARLLRVYIDKTGGITHADCELISHRLSQLLDAQDAVPGGSYTLEVSSPGIERKLCKPRDFERAVGQKIRLTSREAIGGQMRFEGKLTGFNGSVLELEVGPGKLLHIPLEQVQRANLKFEW
jgi:ribosome maturation factor RimP